MKKVFLSGVALVSLAAGAVQAAEPIKLGITGQAREWAGFASNKDTINGGGAANRLNGFDVQDDVRLNFVGSTKLDNGLTVGVEVDTEGTQSQYSLQNGPNKNIRHSFATVSGGFGTVELGEQENVGALIHNSSPDVGWIGGQDNYFGDWIATPANFTENRQKTYAGDDKSSNKIIYITPTFAGLSAGISYTPTVDKSQTGHTSIPSSNDAFTLNTNGTLATLGGDLYVYGLSYVNSFGDLSVKADVGAGNASVGNLRVYQGGLNLGYKGFTFGGSVLHRDTDSDGAAYEVAVGKGTSWDVGLAYATGPYTVSLTYFQGEARSYNTGNRTTGTSLGYDQDRVWALSGAYDLGPGIKLTESLVNVVYDPYDHLTADKNSGWGAITGLYIDF